MGNIICLTYSKISKLKNFEKNYTFGLLRAKTIILLKKKLKIPRHTAPVSVRITDWFSTGKVTPVDVTWLVLYHECEIL